MDTLLALRTLMLSVLKRAETPEQFCSIGAKVEIVEAIENALPHLQTPASVEAAFHETCAQLKAAEREGVVDADVISDEERALLARYKACVQAAVEAIDQIVDHAGKRVLTEEWMRQAIELHSVFEGAMARISQVVPPAVSSTEIVDLLEDVQETIAQKRRRTAGD